MWILEILLLETMATLIHIHLQPTFTFHGDSVILCIKNGNSEKLVESQIEAENVYGAAWAPQSGGVSFSSWSFSKVSKIECFWVGSYWPEETRKRTCLARCYDDDWGKTRRRSFVKNVQDARLTFPNLPKSKMTFLWIARYTQLLRDYLGSRIYPWCDLSSWLFLVGDKSIAIFTLNDKKRKYSTILNSVKINLM